MNIIEKIDNSIERIVVIGSGCSTDILLDEESRTFDKSFVITTNGTVSIPNRPVNIFVCNDSHAVPYWKHHKNIDSNTIWVRNSDYIETGKAIPVDRNQVFESRKCEGSGAEIIGIAYYLWSNTGIPVSIYGFDYIDVIVEGHKPKVTDNRLRYGYIQYLLSKKMFTYPSKMEVMPYQECIRLPENWFDLKCVFIRSQIPHYKKHISIIKKYFYDEKFSSSVTYYGLKDRKYVFGV
jgi:hypothetical protein